MGRTTMSNEFMNSLIYLNGKINPTQDFLVFFIFPIRASYIIWLYIMMDLHQGINVMPSIYLITGAHLFYYLKNIVPSLPLAREVFTLKTPGIFKLISDYFRLDEKDFEQPKFED